VGAADARAWRWLLVQLVAMRLLSYTFPVITAVLTNLLTTNSFGEQLGQGSQQMGATGARSARQSCSSLASWTPNFELASHTLNLTMGVSILI